MSVYHIRGVIVIEVNKKGIRLTLGLLGLQESLRISGLLRNLGRHKSRLYTDVAEVEGQHLFIRVVGFGLIRL